ncbi:intradiol ring-cleavage dioxygenase [Sediminicola sp. 1XM1-17]|uniref:intradiol ring-cleavage dioxygenase n=1 Tax=Sediminicola sp. 1XM1-17 TaxID=3127702 RepID=UPI003076AD69
MMKTCIGLLFVLLSMGSCKGQSDETTKNQKVGGPCEDCEAALDYQVLKIDPTPIDTLEGFKNTDPKIKITGTVLKPDGKTPADNVILYVYQTSRAGIYEPSINPVGWEKRHGKFRGWMKTGTDGRYTFYTFRPAPYPDGREPAHIHLYIKEADKNPYYVDNYLFSDDPILREKEKEDLDNRGGPGIVTFEEKDGILTAHRDIFLGLNIPDY